MQGRYKGVHASSFQIFHPHSHCQTHVVDRCDASSTSAPLPLVCLRRRPTKKKKNKKQNKTRTTQVGGHRHFRQLVGSVTSRQPAFSATPYLLRRSGRHSWQQRLAHVRAPIHPADRFFTSDSTTPGHAATATWPLAPSLPLASDDEQPRMQGVRGRKTRQEIRGERGQVCGRVRRAWQG